jgi:hypothetical protein
MDSRPGGVQVNRDTVFVMNPDYRSIQFYRVTNGFLLDKLAIEERIEVTQRGGVPTP